MTDRDGTEDEVEGTLPQDEPVETPAQAIERLAGELEGVLRRTSGPSLEFVRGATVFAVQTGSKVEFRLRAEVAAAGLKTAATSKSARGADWIVLDTSAGDVFTVDRTAAWFETAWRFAAGPAGGARLN
jgi:hypothetical protein